MSARPRLLLSLPTDAYIAGLVQLVPKETELAFRRSHDIAG